MTNFVKSSVFWFEQTHQIVQTHQLTTLQVALSRSKLVRLSQDRLQIKWQTVAICILLFTYISIPMEQHALKNANNCWNTNIYSYLETPRSQNSNLNLNVVHYFNSSVYQTSWQLKTVVFLHRGLICAVLLLPLYESQHGNWYNFPNEPIYKENLVYQCSFLCIIYQSPPVVICIPLSTLPYGVLALLIRNALQYNSLERLTPLRWSTL